MDSKNTLPLQLLVNTNLDKGEKLLTDDGFNRLCIIGKSDNGRDGTIGLYTSIDEVARDYGVEASEYLIARNHFNQFVDGEVLIATADYASISRPPIVPPDEPEPEPEPDDGDFVLDYVAVNYEPIDVPPPEPIPPPYVEPDPEPEPEPAPACISNEVEFNTFRPDPIAMSSSDSVSVWAAIEIDGVDYIAGTRPIALEDFTEEVDLKGAGYSANKMLDTIFESLIESAPDVEAYINSHTNYPVTSFDFGKRFSGVDDSNKDDLVEVINSIGGQASNFRLDPIVIKIKVLPVDVLKSKITRGSRSVNLIDLFNKGKDFILQSCLAYDYTPPAIGSGCQMKEARFNTVNDTYFDYEYDVVVTAKIAVGEHVDVVSLPAKLTTDYKNDVYKNGIVNTGNKTLIELFKQFIKQNPDYDSVIKSRTNYLLSSHDFSRALGGIDGSNVDAFTAAMKSAGGQARNFKSVKTVITVDALSNDELIDVTNKSGGALVLDFTALFNMNSGIDLESCLKFDYEKPQHGSIGGSDGDGDDGFVWTPIVVPDPPATMNSPLTFTTINGNSSYGHNGINSFAAAFSLTVAYAPESNGNFVIRENGVIIFDNTQSSSLTTPKPLYGDYEQHHVIRSYIESNDGGDVTHTLVFGDRWQETYREEPILDVNGEETGENELITHPLLEGRTLTNHYTIEATAGGRFKAYFTIHQQVDPAGNPITIEVTNFGDMVHNVQFITGYHNVLIPSYLPPTLTNLDKMFMMANAFNDDISVWDMRYVRNIRSFFYQNPYFNRDLSKWCLSQFDPNNPDGVYGYTPFDDQYISLPSLLPEHYPRWGRCPDDEQSSN